jgi:DMSO reductase anchor subunit
MPPTSRTEPRIYIKPHPAAETALQLPQILNLEEYAPQRKRGSTWAARSEIPLLIFTLLSQMAVGISWILGILTFFSVTYSSALYPAIGIIMGPGLIVSFLHLGAPKNAWRVFFNLKKSWLSREILAALLFMVSWAITFPIILLPGSLEISKGIMSEITSLAGLGLVFSMSEVYRLRMVPTWNTWRTKATFLLTTVILGTFSVGMMQVLIAGPIIDLLHFSGWLSVFGIVFLSTELALCYSETSNARSAAHYTRILFILLGIVGAFLLVFSPPQYRGLTVIGIFPVVIVEELIGRWVFYSSRNPTM